MFHSPHPQIAFLFPIVIIAMLYINALIVHLYKNRHYLGFIRETVQTGTLIDVLIDDSKIVFVIFWN